MSNILKQANDNPEPGSENQNNLMTSKGGMQMPRTMYDNAYNNVGSSSISRQAQPNPNFTSQVRSSSLLGGLVNDGNCQNLSLEA